MCNYEFNQNEWVHEKLDETSLKQDINWLYSYLNEISVLLKLSNLLLIRRFYSNENSANVGQVLID